MIEEDYFLEIIAASSRAFSPELRSRLSAVAHAGFEFVLLHYTSLPRYRRVLHAIISCRPFLACPSAGHVLIKITGLRAIVRAAFARAFLGDFMTHRPLTRFGGARRHFAHSRISGHHHFCLRPKAACRPATSARPPSFLHYRSREISSHGARPASQHILDDTVFDSSSARAPLSAPGVPGAPRGVAMLACHAPTIVGPSDGRRRCRPKLASALPQEEKPPHHYYRPISPMPLALMPHSAGRFPAKFHYFSLLP